MNETTLFLAQVIGPTLAILGLGMLINSSFYLKVMKDIFEPKGAFLITNMAMLATGMAMMSKHFLWGSLPEILVTIVGLGILIKGILASLMPNAFDNLVDTMTKAGALSFGGLIWVIGGGYLTWLGFLA
jgi:uncharacterized membrane protein